MYVTFIGFKLLKDLFEKDDKFCDIWFERKQISKGGFLLQDEYLFKGTRLCVPKCSL